jgi:hypothetical protein
MLASNGRGLSYYTQEALNELFADAFAEGVDIGRMRANDEGGGRV